MSTGHSFAFNSHFNIIDYIKTNSKYNFQIQTAPGYFFTIINSLPRMNELVKSLEIFPIIYKHKCDGIIKWNIDKELVQHYIKL